MRVVADSHAVYWYLVSPDRLSARALDVLTAAESTEGIVVPAVTMPDLWMAVTCKRDERAVPRSGYELLRTALLDPTTNLTVAPLETSAQGRGVRRGPWACVVVQDGTARSSSEFLRQSSSRGDAMGREACLLPTRAQASES